MTVVKTMPFNTVNFRRVLKEHHDLAEARLNLLRRRVADHCFRSITVGSPITGAPGQPIDKGDLIKSWRMLPQNDQDKILIVSNLIYAPIIEDNWRDAQLRSKVGGFHSVKMTKLAFNLIVAYELAIVKRAITDTRGRGSQMRDPSTGRFV